MITCTYCKKEIENGDEFFVDPYDVESYLNTFIHKSCFKEREQEL